MDRKFFNEFPLVTEAPDDSIMLLNDGNGVKGIKAKDLKINLQPNRRLEIVDLGTAYTTELKEDISSGAFKKAVTGGKLTINSHVYYFAHPDYWLHTGDTECTTHHMAVVPGGNLVGNHKMNSANTTAGAYVGSDLYTGNNDNTGLADIKAIIKADFGAANILRSEERRVGNECH